MSHYLENQVTVPSGVWHALALYTCAVQHEQSGQLDSALSLSCQAFRMESNVKAYHTQETLASIKAAQTSAAKPGEDVDQLATIPQWAVIIKSGEDQGGAVTGSLASLLEGFPPDLVLEPEEEKPIHLNALPEEPNALPPELVVLSYKPPQIPNLESMISVVTQYQSDYRRVYIEHLRVRLDVCHYVRLITYNRYLRFFPDGKVLSLLANEETITRASYPHFEAFATQKGISSLPQLLLGFIRLFVGTWKLSCSMITISNLIDAGGRYPIPPVANPGANEQFPRYSFSKNKLDLTAYHSVDLENGNTTPLGLRNERGFWFSRVKSFPPF
ncbi:hypothetical protein B0H19DRAFT_1209310 [Mycena capillaripes]|nr:hypothetical protein B0H19DRAFT_1209310 [Mycena capillaripes]